MFISKLKFRQIFTGLVVIDRAGVGLPIYDRQHRRPERR